MAKKILSVFTTLKLIIEIRHLEGMSTKIEHQSQIAAKSRKSEDMHREISYHFVDMK